MWKLVEIDADLSNLTSETKHVMSLINPASTYMDLNIGIALFLASGGDGWIYEAIDKNEKFHHRVKYKSEAKILLVGSGADEQCAGYGRHRTKYRQGGWVGLNEEMKLDIQRIWKRNLGRDDRCIADNGKEARFPFLDEDVMRTLLAFPLWEITNLEKPAGTGDKKILREDCDLSSIHIIFSRLQNCLICMKQQFYLKEQYSLAQGLQGNPIVRISEATVPQTRPQQGV